MPIDASAATMVVSLSTRTVAPLLAIFTSNASSVSASPAVAEADLANKCG